MRFLLKSQLVPAPPPPSPVDPYKPNPYIVQTRPYFYFHIPKAVYTQARAGYQVRYAINRRGFRGPVVQPKKNNVKRLVVIGDSIAEGHGNTFEQTFPYLLNEHLQSTGWEVVNAGVQGASPIYYAANAKRYLALQPDAVLLLLYENDLREDRVRETIYFNLPYFDDADRILQPSAQSGLPWSYLLLALTRLRRNFLLSPLERLIASNKKQTEANPEYQPLPNADPFLISPASLDECWQLSETYLDYLADALQRHGVRLLVANLSIYTVRPGSTSAHQTYARTVDEHAAAWAGRRQLPFLSLLPVIRQAFAERKISEVMIKGDGHPTAETHARIEAVLRSWLQQHL
ncbi:hypothetical protein GCAAIG_05095 [Candidatus Electronema halotolerans]